MGFLYGEPFRHLFRFQLPYYLIPYGQKRIRPTLVSMYNYLSPIIATIVSIWTGLDYLTWHKVIAAIAIVGGVILVSKSRAAESGRS